MSDNVTITPGAGATVKADDVGGGILAQDVKAGYGPDGTWNYVDTPTGLPVQFQYPKTQVLTYASISTSSSGDQTVISGTASQTIRVYRMFLTVASQISLKFGDTTVTYFTGAMPFGPNNGVVLDFTGEPWFLTASGKGFVINLSGATLIAGIVGYTKSA
jgi:hypothetical protein